MPVTATTLGIIGTSPRPAAGPVRAGNLARLQEQVGALESAPPGSFWAGHAACHALMNGIPRVVFAGVADLGNARELDAALGRLDGQDVDLVVAPGAVSVAPALVDEWFRRRAAGGFEGAELWLDSPRGATAESARAHARQLGAGDGGIRVALPWVDTLTPGRRSSEPLPASCIAAPLYLGTATTLAGLHSLTASFSDADAARLQQAGCALLVHGRDKRRLVRLAFPPPRALPGEPLEPVSLAGRIEEALRLACEPALQLGPGVGMWRTMERNARAALERFRGRGEISAFAVRCDAETNQDVVGGAAIEVAIKLPTRVREMILRVGVVER